jgi:hypothetical protein
LVEVEHSVDTILTKFIDKGHHFGEILFIVPVFLWFYSCPPELKLTYIAPSRTAFMPSSL